MILSEYEFLQCSDNSKSHYLEKNNFQQIKNFILQNQEVAQFLKPIFKKDFGEVLQAQNFVGVIQCKDGTTIEILPKIHKINNSGTDKKQEKLTKEILLKMLKTLKKSPFKNIDFACLNPGNLPLLEIFITMFLDEFSKVFKQGVVKNYLLEQSNSAFLKGKLLIPQNIKYNSINQSQFFVEYENFTADIAINRLIKTTLLFLTKVSKNIDNQKKIRQALFVFEDISISKNSKSDFQSIMFTRQNKHYESLILWSKVFLFNQSFSNYKGNEIAFALLYDMNLLFESFVGDYLKKKNPLKKIKIQDKTHHLAYQEKIGKFALKPDIVMDDGEIILDTKWKTLDTEENLSQSDIYQMFAYAKKYKNCKTVYLIYPYPNPTVAIDIKPYQFEKDSDSQNLQIAFFDLFKDKNALSCKL